MADETLDILDTRATIRPSVDTTHGDEALQALRALGDRSGGLVLGETLGKGGMGLVRLGEQQSVGRTVAIKTLRPGAGTADAALSLLREGWVTGRLEHPNVVPVYDVGTDASGQPFLVLKRIDGDVWTELIANPDRVREVHGATDVLEFHLRVLFAVCQAIRFAHTRRILHRDLKPDNVMVGQFGEVYVLDWGIASALDPDPHGRLPSRTAGLSGTPAYMAPEMFAGAAPDVRMDVYLLGALLHEVLTGRSPQAVTSLDDARALAGKPKVVEAPDEPELVALCTEALAPSPDDRPPTAEAFAQRLRDALEHRDSLRMASTAEARADQLGDETDPELRRQLFAEARFGWQQALERWPGNDRARTRLCEAASAMARWELDQGHLAGATALVRAHPDLDPEVVRQVRAAEDEAQLEHAQLRALQRDMDTSIGVRTRLFLSMLIGVFFVVLPLFGWTVEDWLMTMPPALVTAGWAGLVFLVLGGLVFWARDSLSKTTLNRAFALNMLAIPFGQLALAVGAAMTGEGLHDILRNHFLMWSAMAAGAAAALDVRLMVTSVAYLTCWLVTAEHPTWSFPVMAVGDLLFAANLFVIWAEDYRNAE